MDQNISLPSLPHETFQEAVRDIIKEHLKEPFENYRIIYSSGSKKGDNYVGIVYRIQIYDKVDDQLKLSLILKVSPENPTRRSEFFISVFFNRESDFYDLVYPMYKNFQEEKGIDIQKDGFHAVPFCYKTLRDDPHEGQFFEDLNPQGFELFDRFKELKKENVFMVMKALAKMHALFYAIRDQKPQLAQPFCELKELFMLVLDRENSPLSVWYESIKKQAVEVADKIENLDMRQRVQKILKKNLKEGLDFCFDRERIGSYGCLNHGDCWNNNMMFLNDKDGNPVDLRLLDFQIMRYASPVCDLMYYIFGCTTKSLRNKYYQSFIDTYYDELSTFIKRLGSDPEKLFPRDIFDAHLKTFGHFGIIMAVMVIPFFTSEAEDAPDMDELAENMRKIGENVKVDDDAFNITTEKNYDVYAERFTDVCEDMYNLGYI